MIGKCLRPLPNKWKGLTDPEARVRTRYVDLAVNAESRDLIAARSNVLRSIRETLIAKGFIEVETPILQQIHGGATARPFVTHINSLRHGPVSCASLPSCISSGCASGAWSGCSSWAALSATRGSTSATTRSSPCWRRIRRTPTTPIWIDGCRELIQNAAEAANGAQVVMRPRPDGADGRLEAVDISGVWPVKTVHDAVSEALGEHIDADTSLAKLRKLSDAAHIPYLAHWDAGAVVLELYEHLVEDRTEQPTFYIDFPTSVSPLTRPHRSKPGVAERWDLVAWGVELGTAYSELTDPVEQRRRLQEQSLLAAGGDPEAMELDEDFLQAMEYAMPPTGGLGMGVDRVVMLITGRSIRETLPFPLAKPRLANAAYRPARH